MKGASSSTLSARYDAGRASAHPDAPIDWQALVDHTASVPITATIEDAYQIFVESRHSFVGVTDGHRVTGLCRLSEIRVLLGGGQGDSLFAKEPILPHLVASPVFVHPSDAATPVLERVFGRNEEEFDDDVVLRGDEGEFLGIIAVQTLVRLQTSLLAEKISTLEEQARALNRSRDELAASALSLNDANVQLQAARDEAFRARDLLRTVIDNLPDSIFAKDRTGRFLMVNASVARLMQRDSPEEVVGRTDFELLPSDRATHYDAVDQEVMRTGEPAINLEEPSVDSEGRKRWDSTTKVPLRNSEGEVIGLVAISRDITRQKLAEEQLLGANAELSKGREELLAAMENLRAAHGELRSVQLQLIEAEKLKSVGRLAAGVAHEVKNPLAIISMGLEYLAQEHFAEQSSVPSVLDEIRVALKRADSIVKELLDFSAPKRLELDHEEILPIIDESLSLLRVQLASVDVRREGETNLPRLRIDRHKMGQVFLNLFNNALQAMEHSGTLTIRLRAEQLSGVGSNISDSRSESFRVGDRVVVIEIDDTGPGIPEGKEDKLFDPFFTTKPTGQGTGLGLAVTKTIMDLHGGTIGIGNLPDSGARVTLIFKV